MAGTDDGWSAKPNKLFMPSTFEERGVLAPFTTPLLQASRVRPDDRQGMVLLMPGFGGAHGCYVVPWKAVPELASMTIHDRALYDDIVNNKIVAPEGMRTAGLRIAATGLAGPRARQTAEATLRADDNQKIETHFLLILRLLQMLSIDHKPLLSMDPKSGNWRTATRAMLTQAGARLHVGVEDVYRRLENISKLLTPIGLVVLSQSGRLRRMLASIHELRESNEAAALEAVPEAAELHTFAAVVAQHTIEIAERLFIRIDAAVQDIPRMLAEWEEERASAERLVGRISWLLDGWDQVVGAWSDLADLTGGDRNVQLPYFCRLLPLVPRNESGGEEGQTRRNLDRVYQTNRVRQLEDWRSGQLDVELIRRIESARIKSAGVGAHGA